MGMNTGNIKRTVPAVAVVLLMLFTAAAPAIDAAACRSAYGLPSEDVPDDPLPGIGEQVSDILGGSGISDLLGRLGLQGILGEDISAEGILDALLEELSLPISGVRGVLDALDALGGTVSYHWDSIDIGEYLALEDVDVDLIGTEGVCTGIRAGIGSVVLRAAGITVFSITGISLQNDWLLGDNSFSVGSVHILGKEEPLGFRISKTVGDDGNVYELTLGTFRAKYVYYPTVDRADEIELVFGSSTITVDDVEYSIKDLTFSMPGKRALACDVTIASATDSDGGDATGRIRPVVSNELPDWVGFGIPELGTFRAAGGTMEIRNTAERFDVRLSADSLEGRIFGIGDVL